MAKYVQKILQSVNSLPKFSIQSLRINTCIAQKRLIDCSRNRLTFQSAMRVTQRTFADTVWCARPVLVQPFVQLRGVTMACKPAELINRELSTARWTSMHCSSRRTFAAKAAAVDTDKQAALEQEISVNALSTKVTATHTCCRAGLCFRQYRSDQVPHACQSVVYLWKLPC